MFNGEKGVDVVFPGINLATLLVVSHRRILGRAWARARGWMGTLGQVDTGRCGGCGGVCEVAVC